MQHLPFLSHWSSSDSQSSSPWQTGSSRVLVFSVLALLFVLTGCLTPLQDRTVFFLSLHPVIINSEHDVYRHFMTLEDPVTRKHVKVEMRSLLSSARIEAASIIPPKEDTGDEFTRRYGLRIYPDHIGKMALREIMGHKGASPLAIVIDGFLVGTTTLDRNRYSEEYLDLPNLWSLKEAQNFIHNVKRNRKQAER